MIVIVVIVLILALLYANGTFNTSSSGGGGGGGSATVDITAVNFAFSGASNCWTSATGAGGVVAAGGQWTETDTLSYTAGLFQPSSGTVQSVSVATQGFSIVTANVPLVVDSGGSQTLSVTVTVPSTSYTGALSVNVVDTSP